MAGLYVYDNVGIALRCFALGIFGGLGSAFYLVQNGLFRSAGHASNEATSERASTMLSSMLQ